MLETGGDFTQLQRPFEGLCEYGSQLNSMGASTGAQVISRKSQAGGTHTIRSKTKRNYFSAVKKNPIWLSFCNTKCLKLHILFFSIIKLLIATLYGLSFVIYGTVIVF